MSAEVINIVIADDHEMIIAGLRSLLDDHKEFNILAGVHNGKEAIKILDYITPDVYLMDVDMPEMNGIEATEFIKTKNPDVKVIVLTVHNELGVISKVKDAGADGYVLKNVTEDELISAIQSVMKGKKYFSPEVTSNILNRISDDSKPKGTGIHLTEREIEILKLITEGLSNTQIGEKLFISPRTVDTHRTNLMKKIEVNNIAGLIKYAIKNGFVD